MSAPPDLPAVVERAFEVSRRSGYVSFCRNETGRLLAMLAATDVAKIDDPAAYETWISTANDRLSAGLAALLDSRMKLDTASARIDEANTRMEDRANLYKNRVAEMVEVDSYEAATTITALETQLQASYAATARLSQLSFLNFMS